MRKLDWDYTGHAKAYVNRPDYSDAAIDAVLAIVKPETESMDLGAGAGHLTIKLAERGQPVLALEPNADMRGQGQERTRQFAHVRWMDGVMEATGIADASLPMTTYGSSFGVVDRHNTLVEASRILKDNGWFVCMFNHRSLDDPLQMAIEDLIRTRLPDYDYGTRRQDQTAVIEAQGDFGPVHRLSCPVMHQVDAEVWADAWWSHITLKRQAGDAFDGIVTEIVEIVRAQGQSVLEIPYMTRVWMARRTPRSPVTA